MPPCFFRAILVALVLVASSSPPAHAAPSRVHAIVGARIVTEPGVVLPRGTIVIRDGVITAVGANVAVPADARLWNADSLRDATYDESYILAGRLSQAGVRFCMADGGGADDAMTARNLPYNAASGIGLGLTREEALKSITLYPAQILGLADRLGSIEVGKTADLLIADGDPLEVTTHVEQVYINGKPTSMQNRQTRLFEKYNAKPRDAKARKR